MQKVYSLRKNFVGEYALEEEVLIGKIALKTKEKEWENTPLPVVIPISIHSSFHFGLPGGLKMKALINTIQSYTQGRVTLLLTEMAHLKVLSLQYDQDEQQAFVQLMYDAQALAIRFQDLFNGFQVVYWSQFIQTDPSYTKWSERVLNLYKTDPLFAEKIHADALSTCSHACFSELSLFLEKAAEDLLEQCIASCILSEKGYRYSFYPGPQYAAVEYINQILCMGALQFIHVFVAIERRKIERKQSMSYV